MNADSEHIHKDQQRFDYPAQNPSIEIMATKTTQTYVDDIDDSTEDVQTVKFGYEGVSYEIDLSKDNRKQFSDAIATYVGHARKVGGTSSAAKRSSSSKAPSDGPDAKSVRTWAAENDVTVPARGRIPSSVVEQYNAAH